MDFNVPNARDVTKLKEVALAIATIFKSHGANHCVFLAHMAAYCKEDTVEDPIDDEVAIYQAFQKLGFGAQQRVRCLLSQPGGYANSAKTSDWFADSRLMYLAPNDVAARGDAPNVAGNDWRVNCELARKTQIRQTPTLPTSAEYLHVGGLVASSADVKVGKQDKAAQRGAALTKLHLEALLNSGILQVPCLATQIRYGSLKLSEIHKV